MNTELPPFTPLAIVGIGCLFPKAHAPGAYWANIKNGVDCIGDVPTGTHWNPADYFDADPKRPDFTYARRGGFLEAVEFNPLEFGIAPRDLEATDTSQLLGLVAAKQALTDAGVVLANPDRQTGADDSLGARRPVDRGRVSVILGVTGTLELVIPLGARLGHPHWKRALNDAGVAADVAADVCERIAESYVPWQENSFPGLLGNVVAGRIANKLDLHGTNCVVDAACASSLSALHLAAMELQTGKADVVVTGGVDTFNDIFMYMCFSKTPALSPTGDSKPFDANGDGTILGEGLGMVVLKRLADAERDGDRVYAVLRGIGTSSDGKGNAIYAPSSEGQRRCLIDAYTRAGISPATVELVEAHGTGTKVGDATEARALREVFGSAWPADPNAPPAQSRGIAIGSVKSMIGHTKAAAGAASLIKIALALYNKVLPPTLKVAKPVEPLAEADSPFYVNSRMRPWLPQARHPRRAGVSAFGFGGSNFHAVMEEYSPEKLNPDWDGQVEIWAIGKATLAELMGELAALPAEWPAFARAAKDSRSSFSGESEYRLIVVAHRTLTDLSKLKAAVAAKLSADSHATGWHLRDGASYGRGRSGKLSVIFPGQGSQHVGMLRDLACTFPEVLDTLAGANHELIGGQRLTDAIYPPSVFSPDEKSRHDDALRDTQFAQPALGAVELGAWRLLRDRFGVAAEAFAGHSFGELAALAAAGRLHFAECHRLARLRGRLMADASRGTGDAGGMVAVIAPLADVQTLLTRQTLRLVVANKNAPNQTVLSGPTSEIDRALQLLPEAGLKAVRLPVAAAFHSGLVTDAARPFRAELQAVAFNPGSTVYANSTADPYPTDADSARDLLGQQLARPVEFVDMVRRMVRDGVTTFLEVGPGTVLSRLVEAIHPEAVAIPLDASTGAKPGLLDLAFALARLAAQGHRVNLTEWERGSTNCPPDVATRPGLAVPISGANIVSPRPKKPARIVPQSNTTRPVGIRTMSDSPSNADVHAALNMTQQTLAALQRMQEQTASLHKQFLDSQEQAQRTLQALVAQQAAFLGQAPMPKAVPAPASLPLPVPPPPPPSVAPTPAKLPPAPAAVAPLLPPSAMIATPSPKPVTPPARKPAPVLAPAVDVGDVLMAVVAEKTGYPVSLLTLDMTLDADLGVDSIKRVEILSALQEKLPHAPVVKPEHLGRLHSLRDVALFLDGGGRVPEAVDPVQTGPARPVALSIPDPPETLRLPAKQSMAEFLGVGLGATSQAAAPAVDVGDVLMAVVAEKTGYPVSLLTLDMTLDADLGVDSIKRVEILSALQEKLPHAPVVKPEHLGRLHSLRDVALFLDGGSSVTAASATVASDPTKTAGMVELVSAQAETVAPSPGLNPEIAPTPPSEMVPKTETISSIRVPQLSDSGRLSEAPPSAEVAVNASANRSAASIAASDKIDRGILQAVDLDPTVPRPRLNLPAGGEVWIVALSGDKLAQQIHAQLEGAGYAPRSIVWCEPGVAETAGAPVAVLLLAPVTVPDGMPFLRWGLQWLQVVSGKLRPAARLGGAACLITVTRLDGAFGLTDLPTSADPTPGGLAGLTKTARLEWPEVACKAVDLDPIFATINPHNAGAAVLEELFTAGPVEVGISETHRCTPEVARTVRKFAPGSLTFGPKDVILVTGGGRGVTAEVAVALAESFRPTVILTGRTPAPSAHEPAWASAAKDESQLKQAIAQQLGPTATPKTVGETYSKLIAQREIRETLSRLEKAGSRAAYVAANVASPRQVADLMQQLQLRYGPITALFHGAGVLADRRIEDLTVDQFDTVYSTKVEGLRYLMEFLESQPLKALVLFSSTTARLGRIGQAAYAVANEVLNKTAQVEARKRPATRVVSINWGPWDGGMVTPALRKVFEAEGVGLIPLAEGALFAVQELNTSGRAVEVLANAKLRPTPKSGGSGVLPAAASVRPTVATPNNITEQAVIFERSLDLSANAVLRSHIIDGRAVLPMALHMEWLAHAALHGNPGLVFHGFNDMRVTNGVMVEDGQFASVRATAGKAVKTDKLYVVPVELRGKRRDGREVVHSRAEVVLTAALPKPHPANPTPSVAPYPHPIDEIYRHFLFHGPDLHGIERVEGVAEGALVGSAYPAPSPSEWFQEPLRGSWCADPLVLDASFQMMILWSYSQHGAGSLPCFAGRYRQFRRAFPTGPVRVVARVTRDDGSFARADIEYIDPADGTLVAHMQDYECVIDPQLNQAFRRNQLLPRTLG